MRALFGMSIYLDLLKRKIGYKERQLQIADRSLNLIVNPETLSGDPTVSISTDHGSLGQVVALDGNNNAASDKFSSIELHEKSIEALDDLKRLFKTSR